MIDIIFIVLLFLVFLVGANNYENFENKATKEDDLYQSNQITALTEGLNENITGTLTGVSTMVGDITGEIGKITEKKDWIEGCVDYVQHCGQEPYWGTCSKEVCVGSGRYRKCKDEDYGCTKWRSKCTPKYPLWKCSPKPSGYSTPPGFPSGWSR